MDEDFGYHRRRKRPSWTSQRYLALSPLLILILWTLILCFGGTTAKQSNTATSTNTYKAVRVPVRPHKAMRGGRGGSRNKIPVLHTSLANARMAGAEQLIPMGEKTLEMGPGVNSISVYKEETPPEATASAVGVGVIPVYNPIGDIHGVYSPIPISTTALVQPNTIPQGATIYYYDAFSAELPTTVYDEDGNAVDLEQLKATKAEIYVQPPPPNQFEHILMMEQPQQQRSIMEDEPPAQDEYIILSTVAVMALLVGALSARRLRSKNVLSSCIENESLEDELAYDTAYTTSAAAGKYDTFGPWKGDLEKFDV